MSGGGNNNRYAGGRTDYGVMRGAALLGLSSSGASSRSTPIVSSQHNSSYAPPEPVVVTNAGIPQNRLLERVLLNASTGSRFAGLHNRDAERTSASLPGGSSGGSAYTTQVLSMAGATSTTGSGGSSRGRRGLVRGNVGVAEDANMRCRPSMEDRYVVCNPLEPGGGKIFLGVFDGHGGAGAADFAAEVIQHNFTNELKRAERKSLSIAEVFTNTYHETDSQIALAGVSRSSGCTAVSAYMHTDAQGKRLLHVANAGDSRAVLCRNMVLRSEDASNNIEALTRDHKPSDPQERARIEAAGGDVIRGRVMGMLAVSRALGDHALKDWVVSTPEVRSTELGVTDEGFILLACDGVFDVFSNEEAVDIIQNSYRERVLAAAKTLGVRFLSSEQQSNLDISISKVLASDLVERAIQRGSRDNVTCLICLC